MTNQKPQQTIEKAEKKVKKMKRLEKILIGGSALGIGSIIAGTSVDNEILSGYLTLSGLLVGYVSGIAGYHTSVSRQVLEAFLKCYKGDDVLSRYNLNNKSGGYD